MGKHISNGMRITIKNFQKRIPISPKTIKATALKVLSLEKIKKFGEISISFVNNREISRLNLKYLHRRGPTDVLAFDLSDNSDEILADIVISVDSAFENSRLYRTTPGYEIGLYLIHGILHILGYDDTKRRERTIMQKRQENICQYIMPKAWS